MKKRTVLFLCSHCQAPVFRAGKSVDQTRELCGKHSRIRRKNLGEQRVPQNTLKIERKGGQEARSEDISGSLIGYNRRQVDKYEQKLNVVKRLIPTNPELTFTDLWTLAERELS